MALTRYVLWRALVASVLLPDEPALLQIEAVSPLPID